MKDFLQTLMNLNIRNHLIIAFVLRLILIIYGEIHDQVFKVSYTDVDYKVFTDGARHILNGDSPYKRHTYRYSPILALIVIPNILMHHVFGKLLFSLFDVISGYVIYKIVSHSFLKEKKKNENRETKANISALIWLYNPSVFVISTRGNCDAIASAFVLVTIYLLQCKNSPLLAGLTHGFVVHFRLYPLMYSLALFMHLNEYSCNSVTVTNKKKPRRTIFNVDYLKYLIPNLNQLKLMFATLLSLSLFTIICYVLYGYEFLFETYIYHFIRKDTRHNFSLYFYIQYLSADIQSVRWQKILMVLPQYLLIIVLSIRYGLKKSSLSFTLFTITFVMIAYNTVLTSQYFMWLLVILPLCIWQIKLSKSSVMFLTAIWIISQSAWLLPAYLLEFQGKNTFLFIWIQSISFFSCNIGILGRIIQNYKPTDV